MAIASITAVFQNDLQSVWEVVTSLENYTWRSDLKKIEIVSEKRFIEYTKNGFATSFTITAKEPCIRYAFDMENENMKGHWTGVFSQENGNIKICFTEDVKAKKFFMKPFVKLYLKQQQKAYIEDLTKALRDGDKN